MATISFSRTIVVNRKNVKNLVNAAKHPVDVSERINHSQNIRVATKDDLMKMQEKLSK